MAEGARLESVYTGNCIQGSNPCLSAINSITYNWRTLSALRLLENHADNLAVSPRLAFRQNG